jgi:hypothetical protein
MFLVFFYSNGLGACLLDEAQDHNFKFPEMPPGVVYDHEWQCNDHFGPTKPCDLGPVRMTSVYNIPTFHVVCRFLFFPDSVFLVSLQSCNLQNRIVYFLFCVNIAHQNINISDCNMNASVVC